MSKGALQDELVMIGIDNGPVVAKCNEDIYNRVEEDTLDADLDRELATTAKRT